MPVHAEGPSECSAGYVVHVLGYGLVFFGVFGVMVGGVLALAGVDAWPIILGLGAACLVIGIGCMIIGSKTEKK